MKEFLNLLKYEFKMQTPIFNKKGKFDILGVIFIFAFTLLLIAISAYFLYKILNNYILVEINKVYEPIERIKEILTLIYLVVLLVITIFTLERTRKVFADDKNRQLFLRLPLKKRIVFLSKFSVLLLHTAFASLLFLLTINIVVSTIVPVGIKFWIGSTLLFVFMPIICLLLTSLLIVPYIKIIDYLSNRHFILFVFITIVLIVAFYFYTKFLGIIQTLLTTGSIRFIFNKQLVTFLQGLYKYCYPVNSLVAILFESNVIVSYLILILVTCLAVGLVYLISKKLYNVVLYKTSRSATKTIKPRKVKQHSAIFALLKKEFITVFRKPKYSFSYFSIAISMPIMVYCCFTLFKTLIYNALGIEINFALALLTILLFTVLTNTFCSTNVTRDRFAILKMKILPISIYKSLFAKILFCSLISSLAVIVSCILLLFLTNLQFLDALICLFIGLTFSFSQIFIATKLDLKSVKISMSDIEVEEQSSKTLSKVILLGISLAIISSASCILLALFASGVGIFKNVKILQLCIYLLPTLIGVIYLICSILYFRTHLDKYFRNLTN